MKIGSLMHKLKNRAYQVGRSYLLFKGKDRDILPNRIGKFPDPKLCL